jgi:serine/threonine protein kinase
MAPEQCEGKGPIDHRSDVYALGVLLFQMLTGTLPFGGEGCGEIMLKHMTTPVPAPRSIVPDLPPALESILFRALAKNPAERFQSMVELAAALANPEAFTDDVSVPDSTATVREGTDQIAKAEPVVSRHRRRWGLVGAAGAAVSLVTLAFVSASAHKSRPAAVRLNFSSDPNGASVASAAGKVVGFTPLSIEAPYGDKPIAYVVRKPGFVSKTVALVPNLPSPIFVSLQRERIADAPVAKERSRPRPKTPAAPKLKDPDGVLAPTFK